MITIISLVNIFFLVMRTLKIYRVSNFQIDDTYLLTVVNYIPMTYLFHKLRALTAKE